MTCRTHLVYFFACLLVLFIPTTKKYEPPPLSPMAHFPNLKYVTPEISGPPSCNATTSTTPPACIVPCNAPSACTAPSSACTAPSSSVQTATTASTRSTAVCNSAVLNDLARQLGTLILGCQGGGGGGRRRPMKRSRSHPNFSDDRHCGGKRGLYGSPPHERPVSRFLRAAWDDSVEFMTESFEASQDNLSRSLYDSFESLEAYAGPEFLHESLDRYEFYRRRSK